MAQQKKENEISYRKVIKTLVSTQFGWILLGSIILIGLNYRTYWDLFFKDVEYQDRLYIIHTSESIINPSRKNLNTSTIEITLSTDQAFVPQEKIKVNIKVNKGDIISANKKYCIWFPESLQTSKYQEEISNFFNNVECQLSTGKDSNGKTHGQIVQLKIDGFATFNEEDDNYVAISEIKYTRPGEYRFVLFELWPNGQLYELQHSPLKIPIGTTVDLFSVRINRVLLHLTILALLISIISMAKNKN